MEDISKLPKWAQRRIAQLESTVAYQKGQIHELIGGNGNAEDGPPIMFNPDLRDETPLPRGSRVLFMLEEGTNPYKVQSITCSVGRSSKNGPWFLTVRATDGVLSIRPEVSNTIHVRVNKSFSD